MRNQSTGLDGLEDSGAPVLARRSLVVDDSLLHGGIYPSFESCHVLRLSFQATWLELQLSFVLPFLEHL